MTDIGRTHPKGSLETSKINLKHVLLIAPIIVAGWFLALRTSQVVLTQMYEGNSLTSLNDLLTNKDRHPLEYYFHRLEPPIAAAHLMLAVVATIFVVRTRKSAALWLTLLILGDTILLAYSEKYGGPLLNIVVDWSIPEVYQYFKEVFLAVLLVALYRRHKHVLYAIFAGIAIFLFVDDAFKYHETVGHAIAPLISRTPLPALIGTEPNYIGEICSLVPLLFLLPFGAMSFVHVDRGTKRVTLVFTGMLGALFLFGVVIDLIGNLTVSHPVFTIPSIHIVEDFGEMITLSCWLSYTAYRYWKTE
ncbi:MAG: hypothetical protein IIC50_06290 [Planctomycetes bacterium]|nr:hypothetical protein [Planctomycetota bacterium]